MSVPMIRMSSIPLSGGGDTHFHPWDNGRGFTVTTRLPGGYADHQNFRLNRFLSEGPRPDVLKYLK